MLATSLIKGTLLVKSCRKLNKEPASGFLMLIASILILGGWAVSWEASFHSGVICASSRVHNGARPCKAAQMWQGIMDCRVRFGNDIRD